MVTTLKIVGVACAFVLVLGGLYAVKLLLTEDLYTSRGTFAYYVTVQSSNIKEFPVLGAVGEVDYYSSCGDGPKPPANGIRYTSTESADTLRESIEKYLVNRGFTKQEQSSDGGEYIHADGETSLELVIKHEKDDLQRVIATEYYRF